MKVAYAEGTHEKMGFNRGYQLREAIRHNVALREQDTRARGIEKRELSCFTHEYATLSSDSSLHLMEGLSRGRGLPFESIFSFNALQDVLFPEGCTTFAAVGKATPEGKAIVLKNRDKYYYQDREINVFQVLKSSDGNVLGGVTAAGSTGFVMGLTNLA